MNNSTVSWFPHGPGPGDWDDWDDFLGNATQKTPPPSPEYSLPLNLLFYAGNKAGSYTLVTGVILVLCSILAGVGNAIVIAVVVRKRSLWNVTHILIVNLACTHLLISIVCMPIMALAHLVGGQWLLGEVMCRIMGYIHAVLTSVAVLTLGVIALDRYYAVVYPLERKISMFKGKLLIFYAWFHAIVICLPQLFVYRLQNVASGIQVCDVRWEILKLGQIYLLCYTIMTFIIPLLLACLAYVLVWRAFRLSQKKVGTTSTLRRTRNSSYLPHTSKTEVRLLKILSLMVFCFVVFLTPFLTCLFHRYFIPQVTLSQGLVLTAVWICQLEPVLDPLIYGYLNKQFRQSFFEMLSTCPCLCVRELKFDINNIATVTKGHKTQTTTSRLQTPDLNGHPSQLSSRTLSPTPILQLRVNHDIERPSHSSCANGIYDSTDVHRGEIHGTANQSFFDCENDSDPKLCESKDHKSVKKKTGKQLDDLVTSPSTNDVFITCHVSSRSRSFDNDKALLPPIGKNNSQKISKDKHKCGQENSLVRHSTVLPPLQHRPLPCLDVQQLPRRRKKRSFLKSKIRTQPPRTTLKSECESVA